MTDKVWDWDDDVENCYVVDYLVCVDPTKDVMAGRPERLFVMAYAIDIAATIARQYLARSYPKVDLVLVVITKIELSGTADDVWIRAVEAQEEQHDQ